MPYLDQLFFLKPMLLRLVNELGHLNIVEPERDAVFNISELSLVQEKAVIM